MSMNFSKNTNFCGRQKDSAFWMPKSGLPVKSKIFIFDSFRAPGGTRGGSGSRPRAF